MTLTPEQMQHVEMSRAWIGLFRRLCKKYNSQHWRLDLHTVWLLEAARKKDTERVASMYKERQEHMFTAMHFRRQKLITVYCGFKSPAFPKDYAYLGRWADVTVGRNFPFPTFIGHHTPESFANFEELFVQFLRIETEEDVPAFEDYLEKKYDRNTDLQDDDVVEGASCPI